MREEGLYVDILMNPDSDIISSPSSIDPEVPEWVHYFKYKSRYRQFFEILFEARKYDIVHGFYHYAIPLQFTGRPYAILSCGSDYRMLTRELSPSGMLMARAFRKARVFICSQIDQIPLIEKDGYRNVVYLPMPWDEKPVPAVIKPPREEIMILHPPHHIWKGVRSEVCKRNDIFLEGLAAFIKETDKVVKCIILKRGKDFEESMHLIKELKIENNIILKDEVDRNGLNRLMAECDIVADQFGIGSFGLIALEAMYLKKPVLIYINKPCEKLFYGENSPIPRMNTPDEVCAYLKYLMQEGRLEETGRDNYLFVKKHHHHKTAIRKLIKIYEQYMGLQ